MSEDWRNYYMKMAFLVASRSKDRSMKCGCVVVGEGQTVLSTGYNGIPRSCRDDIDSRYERPEKYMWTEHAERNAIYNAARNGIKLLDATAYVTAHPCADCARGLVQAGISMVFYPTKDTDPFFLENRWDDWAESFTKARTILSESQVFLGEIKYAV